MAHFGISCPAVAGHLNPMTALGYELQKRGHRVTVFGVPDAQRQALAAGLDFCAIGAKEYPLGSTSASIAELGKLSGLQAFRYTVASFKHLTTVLLEEAPAALETVGVDLLLVDQVSLGAETVAERLQIPFASVCNALMLNRDPDVPPFLTGWKYSPAQWAQLRNQLGYRLISAMLRPITDAIAEYRQAWNLPPHTHPNQLYSPFAQLCQQPAEFEYPRQHLPECFHFTGPYSNPTSREPAAFPWDKLTGQPLIYASMGTIQNRLLGVFQKIAEACLGLDVQLVIALGGGNRPESLPELPGNPLVVGYAPQLELLQQATLTITHAGMNTTLESLSNGVPLVAIPITNDQPGVAARIAWTGTGEVVPLARLSVQQLRQAIERVLGDASYKTQAMRLQAAIQGAGGASRAADIVERVVATGKPVTSI